MGVIPSNTIIPLTTPFSLSRLHNQAFWGGSYHILDISSYFPWFLMIADRVSYQWEGIFNWTSLHEPVAQGDSTSLLATTCNNLGCYYKKAALR